MNPPLTDVTRCRPIVIDTFCRNCKRWADHPEQTHFNVTRSVNVMSSRDENCAYLPMNPTKGAQACPTNS